MIEVLFPGAYTTIQDLGRKGHEIHGMPASGAFDPFLASIANRLVGNPLEAALLEFALAGPTLRIHRETTFAVVAWNASYRLNGAEIPCFRAASAKAAGLIEFNGMEGWFGYIAFGGGIDHEKVLGSSSTYALGRIGRRLVKGDRIQVGISATAGCALPSEAVGFRSVPIVRILPSLHTDLFAERDLNTLVTNEYRILPNSDRMGIALHGTEINAPRVVKSAPAFPGSLQVLPSGQLLLLGPEGPTTGGYPQIAILSRLSWTMLAQSRPGNKIRFQWTTREQALQMLEYRDSIFKTEAAWRHL